MSEIEGDRGAVPEVDLRVLQANERTLLAWVRTAIALVGFGFLVARFGAEERGGSLVAIGVGCATVLLGVASNLVAARRFASTRRALLAFKPVVPDATSPVGLAMAVSLLGLLVAAYLVMRGNGG